MPPALTKETETLLASILPPKGAITTPATDALYAAVAPINAMIHATVTRIAEVQAARRAADACETEPAAYAFFNRIKAVLGGMEREVKIIENAADALTEASFNLDTYALAMQGSLATHDARRGAEAAAAASVAAMP